MPLYYIAHRLFAAHDRALGAYIASELAREAGPENVFLPFCDTDEENLTADCKGRLLFEMDCTRLRRTTGMIAVLHGPSLDDGVCMEIGFATARRTPVILVSTDFQTYAPAHGGRRFAFPDPLLEHLATGVIRAHKLGPDTAFRPPGEDRFRRFLDRNTDPVRSAALAAATELLRLSRQPGRQAETVVQTVRDLAYIEPSPYMDDPMWEDIGSELHCRGWRVSTARRFGAGADPVTAASEDWAAATSAGLAIVDARGPEAPPGTALVIGARTAGRRPVLAACPASWQTLASGREPNWRNLMIQYAVTARFSTAAGFTAAMSALP